MPELPEAETIVRGIRAAVTSCRIRDVEVIHSDVLRAPEARLRKELPGRRIVGVGRRAKNVQLLLDDGAVVWINLGMTGGLLPLQRPPVPAAAAARYGSAATHPAVVFLLDQAVDLVFDDSRRFGSVERLDAAASRARSAMFGPEPLEEAFTPRGLWDTLRSSRSPLRSFLLDQKRIAGIGNIYANEALFRSGLHPARRSHTVRRHEAEALHAAIRDVLTSAVNAGGTTIRDYRNADGRAGEYAPALSAYGREGSPCPRCSTPIRKVVFGGRSAFFCPLCQPRRGTARGRSLGFR